MVLVIGFQKTNMFKIAKIKLTLWYLLIIMVVSVFLSFLIYRGVTSITDRALHMQMIRMERRFEPNFPGPRREPIFEEETLIEIQENLVYSLVKINLAILVLSALAGYFLAHKTLKPIEDMVEEQKRFISDASHELKTPITALKTELEVSLNEKDADKKDLIKQLKSNLEEVNKLQRLTESLLKDNKYEKGTFDNQMKTVNLKTIIEHVLKSFEKEAKRKEVSLVADLKDASVKGDENSLKELVSILIDNAIKFSKKEQQINVKLYTDGSNSFIEVQDRGVGIKTEDQENIFKRFYQVEYSRNKIKNDGFGLGLSIAKKIAQLHNGSISLSSEPDKGSVFTVKLPSSL